MKKLKGFPDDANWPAFKWSSNDRFFAQLSDGVITIWEINKGGQVAPWHKISLEGIKIPEFSFSPGEGQSLISYWVPELGNIPARVVLFDVSARKDRRQKNLFNVSDCKMYWQNKGDYLCVKVDRSSKTKKVASTNFEIFFAKEKDVPVEVVEKKDFIIAFAWEPNGARFAVIHSSLEVGGPRNEVSFYTLEGKNCKLIRTLDKRPASHLFWSPRGDNILIAQIKSSTGNLEFYNVTENEVMGTGEHYSTTDIEWDPSGRYVVTYASAWKHQLENGYCIWSFQGKLLTKVQREKFFQFLWRPRPKTILKEKQTAEVKKNIKTLSKQYLAEEREKKKGSKRKLTAKREQQKMEFDAFLLKRRSEYTTEAALRRRPYVFTLRDYSENDVVTKELEDVIETFVQEVD